MVITKLRRHEPDNRHPEGRRPYYTARVKMHPGAPAVPVTSYYGSWMTDFAPMREVTPAVAAELSKRTRRERKAHGELP